MNKETFAKYISDPSLLDNDTLPEIKAMLDEFPYFQSAWVLYIKNLHAIKDIRYENKLKTASAFVSDRKHLHDLLKGTYIPTITPVPVHTQFIASPQEPEQPQSDDANPDTVETQNLVSLPETQEEDFTPVQTQFIASPQEENVPTPKPEISQQQIKEAIEKQLQSLGINANITFSDGSANIKIDFGANAEKQASSKEENVIEQPIEQEVIAEKPHEDKPQTHSSKRQKMDLIDQFLVSEAKIVPIKNYHSDSKLSTESLLEDEELFSEKLAKIYIKQGLLEKALTTYEKLYLKYPEKSAYFATQIEYVKRLINK
jgi:hypothetical protein